MLSLAASTYGCQSSGTAILSLDPHKYRRQRPINASGQVVHPAWSITSWSVWVPQSTSDPQGEELRLEYWNDRWDESGISRSKSNQIPKEEIITLMMMWRGTWESSTSRQALRSNDGGYQRIAGNWRTRDRAKFAGYILRADLETVVEGACREATIKLNKTI